MMEERTRKNGIGPSNEQPHVVIAGGGFGGTHAAHALRHAPACVQVFATWIWSYLTYDRAVRVLTPDSFQSNIQVVPHADVLAVGADGTPPLRDGVQPSHQQQQLACAAARRRRRAR